ncbi:hypothetical protein ATCC90586_004599 [Pythium insidiosum]|nr:hypothetical protein ATCC90586_004599 [Pythium insidiosum]
MRPGGWNALRLAHTATRVASAVSKDTAPAATRRRKSLLVDGNNVLYHFYNPLKSAESQEVDVTAIDGMFNLLRRMHATHQPEHICVFFDRPKQTTVRKLMVPDYKNDRAPTPRGLRPQLQSAKAFLRQANVNCFSMPGVEADDLIASYTEALVAHGNDVLIVSNDNDFLQLTRGDRDAVLPSNASTDDQDGDATAHGAPRPPCVEVYQLNKRRYLRERHIRSRFSIAPWQLPAYFSLCGILWGKIKRVDGVTDECAVELLAQFETLPRLLRHLNDIEDRAVQATLKRNISSIETAYRIAKLNNDHALPIPIEELLAPDLSRLAATPISIA